MKFNWEVNIVHKKEVDQYKYVCDIFCCKCRSRNRKYFKKRAEFPDDLSLAVSDGYILLIQVE